MSFAQAASSYLAANFTLLAAFGVLAIFAGTSRVFGVALLRRDELSLHYFTLTLSCALACILPFLPRREVFEPMAKLWAAPSAQEFTRKYVASGARGYLALSSSATANMMDLRSLGQWVFVVVFAVTVVGLLKFLYDFLRVSRLLARSYPIRRMRGLTVYVCDEIHVPFSFWRPRARCVVMPANLLVSRDFRIAVLHEIQHHRQGDTRWVYGLWALRVFFAANPVIHLWNRWVTEIQEYACDEALVASRKVDSRAYAGCLITVAETALARERGLVCATGLTFSLDRKTLKRRILHMLDQRKNRFSGRIALLAGAIVAGVASSASYASQGLVQDRRITLAQASEMLKSAQTHGDFPVVVNDRVVKWLNYFAGTPEGREQARAALARMENYRAAIERKLAEYHLPNELMAIPLIEAGYKNMTMNRSPYSAGLWMFIPSTARNFGLRVNDEIDERLNVDLETDAALRYLYSERLRYNDWQLAALSYNAGDKKVNSIIERTGSRDPWVLVRSGLFHRETEDYLPKLMAAILLLRNPAALH